MFPRKGDANTIDLQVFLSELHYLKLFEKVINKRLTDFFNKCKIISDYQFGFCKDHLWG